MYQHLASHTTLTGISKQIRSIQKSEKKSSENLLDHPLNPSVPGSAAQDMPHTCTDIQQIIQHSQEFINRSEVFKKAKTPLWKLTGSPPGPLCTKEHYTRHASYMYRHPTDHTTLTGIFKQVKSIQKSENTPVKASWITPYTLPRPQTRAQTSPRHARYIPDKTPPIGTQVRKSKKLRKGESTKNAI